MNAEDAASLLSAGPILLYDGECGVCSSAVRWILARDRRMTLRFAALESSVGRELRALCSVDPNIDSLLWVEPRDGRGPGVRAYAAGLASVLTYLGGRHALFGRLLGLVPRALADFGYRTFARHRLAIAPRQCLLPSPSERARFLGT